MHFFNQHTESIVEFTAYLELAINSGAKVVMAYSFVSDEFLPDYLFSITPSVEIIQLPDPDKDFVEKVIRDVFATETANFTEKDLQEFLKTPFENLRASEAKFMALICQRQLEKGVFN